MRIDGDIKVWTDGEKACARLYADGPEGPIVVHASAPLAPIRRKVARLFARRGVTVSGDDPGFRSTVEQLARRKAMVRLQAMAPAAFRRGGLGSYLARKELRRRRRRRRALARAGRPVGAKAVGRLRRRRRRWRRPPRVVLPRPKLPRLPSAAALAPALPAAAALAVAARRASGGGGGGAGPGGSASPGGGDGGDEQPAAEEASEEDHNAPQGDDAEESSDETQETEQADDDGEAEADDGDDAEEEDEDMSGDDAALEHARRKQIVRARLGAAMRLLDAAKTNPRARRRVQQIAALAGEGHSEARKAFAALATAHQVRKQTAARTPARAALAPAPGKPLAAAPPRLPLVAAAPATPSAPAATPANEASWWDILAAWRRGMG